MIYLFISAMAALGIIGLAIALRQKPSDRAQGYPQGSYERVTLEEVQP